MYILTYPIEMTRDMKKGIDRMIREFKRDQMRISSEQKKIKKDLENMVKKNEPRVSIFIIFECFSYCFSNLKG
jgi:hypothetical protein